MWNRMCLIALLGQTKNFSAPSYVCVCIYIYIYIYIHTCVCVCWCVCVCVYMCINV